MFSLVFQGFVGPLSAAEAAFLAAFGERGSYFLLAHKRNEYAPCELAANLTQEDAESKAAILREAGMTIEIIPTENVTDVKHRASELWPTHRASNGESFTERDHFVVRGTPLSVKERFRQWWKSNRHGRAWQFELVYNHDHPTHTLDRNGLRIARERGAEIATALTECFPERWFLIVYRDEQVSFCQFAEELPPGISPGKRRVHDTCVCEVCKRSTSYIIRANPDDEFPNVQFADCAICGNEVILWADQEVVLVPDAIRRTLPMPQVPSDAWKRDTLQVRFPSSFAELEVAVQSYLQPTSAWLQAAIRLWLGRNVDDMEIDQLSITQTLLQIEELSALLLLYRIQQYSLPPENQDRSPLTPERLGIPRNSLLYHPIRRALVPVTVRTFIDGILTSHALLNGTDEHYMAGRHRGGSSYECRFHYGTLDTKGRPQWFTSFDGKQYSVYNDTAPHGADPWSCRSYEAASSLKSIRERGMERCMAFTVLYDENKRVIAQHRRFFRYFYELDIEPNPTIDISLRDGTLTLRSDVFVWGVFLDSPDISALPDNAFDLLPGIPYTLPWDEATYGTPRIKCTGNSLLKEVNHASPYNRTPTSAASDAGGS